MNHVESVGASFKKANTTKRPSIDSKSIWIIHQKLPMTYALHLKKQLIRTVVNYRDSLEQLFASTKSLVQRWCYSVEKVNRLTWLDHAVKMTKFQNCFPSTFNIHQASWLVVQNLIWSSTVYSRTGLENALLPQLFPGACLTATHASSG